jgi:hypothetical protein
VTPAKRAGGQRAVLGALVAALVFAFAAPPANAFVYWANFGTPGSGGGTTLGRANLDGSGVNESFITGASGASLPAVDASHIYWTNFNTNAVERANLDGTGVNPSFITGASAPLGMAVDGAHVYWANCGSPSCPGATIGRANLDGTGVNQSFVTGQSVTGVAVDAAYIYWSDFQGGTIGRANIDGSGANNNFITGAIKPGGVAVDGTHIYWVNWNEGGGTTIGRANLDGSGVNQSFITGASGPCGVAVDSAHIYWGNLSINAIGRANLDGSGVNQSFITGANGPCGVAVDGLGAGGGGGPGGSTSLSGLNISPHQVSIAGRKVKGQCVKPTKKNRQHKSCRRPIKLKISYSLNIAATVRFTIALNAPGRRVSGHCLKPTKKNRKKPHCTRAVPVPGSITQSGKAGVNRFTFNGTIGGHSLGPGSYVLTATPSGGKPRTTTFAIAG